MVPDGWKSAVLDELCKKISVGLAISVTPFMRERGVKLIRNQNIKRNANQVIVKLLLIAKLTNEEGKRKRKKRKLNGWTRTMRMRRNK